MTELKESGHPIQPGRTAAHLRPMAAGDLDAVAAWEAELFQGEAWSRTLLEGELAASHGPGADRTYLVATAGPEAGAEILGYAGLWHGSPRAAADLLTIATIPAARRRGIARSLLEALIACALTHDCESVMLEVRASNLAAQRLYASLGFEMLPVRRRGYYQAPREDACVMRLPLLCGEVGSRPGPVGSEVTTINQG